ncbi:response regulator transcription factor [Spiractinospora alimapuensis]|uniref:response regulator transcription factor n=1 Tax=Spiractinospora alimapuensis TaxID=2820884 RepID=UPI001F241CBA|nr:response regulator transcription factor [Spiractinospora alimapuensis]QVQ54431.1 response regulator transcription factor [Spiractinospora alimapuensis]
MRAIIAEDSELLRSGVARLLHDEGVDVVAEARDAEELLAAVASHPDTDLCLVDIRMPPSHTEEGMWAAVRIRREHPAVAVVILSQHVVGHYASEFLAGGAKKVGYLLKDRVADIPEFLATLRRVAAGGAAIDAEVVSQLLTRRDDDLSRLSPRESDVLAAMAEGLNNAGIAARLYVSERAVEKHIRAIFTKLDLGHDSHEHRRVQAVLQYLRGARNPGPSPFDDSGRQHEEWK